MILIERMAGVETTTTRNPGNDTQMLEIHYMGQTDATLARAQGQSHTPLANRAETNST